MMLSASDVSFVLLLRLLLARIDFIGWFLRFAWVLGVAWICKSFVPALVVHVSRQDFQTG